MPELTEADLEAALGSAVGAADPRKAVAFTHACRAANAVPALVRDLLAARAERDCCIELLRWIVFEEKIPEALLDKCVTLPMPVSVYNRAAALLAEIEGQR